MVRTRLQRRRGLKQNGPVRGEKAKVYVDIPRLLDEAMGHFGQIPSGRPNGFHLGPKAACKGNQPSRRVFQPDLFAIWAPRRRCNRVRTLDRSDGPDDRPRAHRLSRRGARLSRKPADRRIAPRRRARTQLVGQIPSGPPKAFSPGPKAPFNGTPPARRVFQPDRFAIWAPRRRCNRVRTLDRSYGPDDRPRAHRLSRRGARLSRKPADRRIAPRRRARNQRVRRPRDLAAVAAHPARARLGGARLARRAWRTRVERDAALHLRRRMRARQRPQPRPNGAENGRAGHHALRDGGTARALSAAHPVGRGLLLPGLFGTGRGVGSCRAPASRRPRWRGLCPLRLEDLDHPRTFRPPHVLPRPYLGRGQATGGAQFPTARTRTAVPRLRANPHPPRPPSG